MTLIILSYVCCIQVNDDLERAYHSMDYSSVCVPQVRYHCSSTHTSQADGRLRAFKVSKT